MGVVAREGNGAPRGASRVDVQARGCSCRFCSLPAGVWRVRGGRGEREVGSISCNGQAISAENIYNFLSI